MNESQMPDAPRVIGEWIEDFVLEKIISCEKDPRVSSHNPNSDLRNWLNSLTRNTELIAPFVPKQWDDIGTCFSMAGPGDAGADRAGFTIFFADVKLEEAILDGPTMSLSNMNSDGITPVGVLHTIDNRFPARKHVT
ncbi:MAG: hypothetical protein V7727_21805 [Sneathiella sp.]